MGAIFDEIVEMIGADAADKIIRSRGGTRIYFPKPEYLTDDHSLVKLIGLEKAKIICHAWGRNNIIIPLAHSKSRAKIEGLIREGLSASEIARACAVTERTVYYHKSRMRAERAQRLRSLAAGAPLPAQHSSRCGK